MFKYIIPEKVKPEIKREQIHILCQQKKSVLVASIFIALITTYVLSDVIEQKRLLIWSSVVIGISLIRLILHLLYKTNVHVKGLARTHLLGTFLAGASWGALALFFDPLWPAVYQVFVFIVFVGIISAAFISNIAVFITFPAFMLPVVACLLFALFQQADEGYLKIALLVIIFAIFMYEAGLRYHSQFVDFLKMRLTNENLTNQLLTTNLKLKQMADTDGLTQIANRRTLNKMLIAEWNRHFRNQKELAYIFIDLDYFKHYNDNYGHDAGDECLITIAEILSTSVKRSSDIVARYGGEEFGIILPETDKDNALAIAEKIRNLIFNKKIPHKGSLISEYVTASMGIASVIPNEQNNEKSLCNSADKALYQAKNNGRNQCIASHE